MSSPLSSLWWNVGKEKRLFFVGVGGSGAVFVLDFNGLIELLGPVVGSVSSAILLNA